MAESNAVDVILATNPRYAEADDFQSVVIETDHPHYVVFAHGPVKDVSISRPTAALILDAPLNAAKAIVAEQLVEALAQYAPPGSVHPDWYGDDDKNTMAALTAWREVCGAT